MKKSLLMLSCAGWLVLLVLSSEAQNAPDGGHGPGRGKERRGFDDPRGRGRDNAHRRLGGLWRGVGELESGATPLSKSQAAQVVALVRPWGNRAQMSENDARNLEAQLRAILTTAQKNALDSRKSGGRGGPERGPRGRKDGEGRGLGRGPRGDGPPQNGPRDGGPREGRGKGAAQRAQLANRNPFYAPTGLPTWNTLPQPLQQRLVDRYQAGRVVLEALSRKSRS